MFVFLVGLIVAFPGAPVHSQSVEDTAVAEPTRLYTVAMSDGSKLLWSEQLGGIESVDARATISVVEVEGSDGEQVRGLKIMLENSTSTDRIYLTESQLFRFRDELEHLEFTRQFDKECKAKRLCLHGIARCQPSQTLRQAYCPGRYTTPTADEGFNLSTPRHSFKFPSVGTGQFITLISEAIRALE